MLNDGRVFDLKVPSGPQTGLKIIVPNLEIRRGGRTDVLLDFDLEDSFVVQGNPNTPAGIKGFIFKPTIRPIRVEIVD